MNSAPPPHGALLVSAFVLVFLADPGGAVNTWMQVPIPEYISCSLPLCDPLCENLESVLGEICPRTASTNLMLFGGIPGPDACYKEVQGWVSGPKPSASDPTGCGPCLLQSEKSRCNVNSGAGRGYSAGGPIARTGHTMIVYETPIRSDYIGATMLIIFGGKDSSGNYLNDVWWYCIENCPDVQINKQTYDKYGVTIQYRLCPPANCRWQEMGIIQNFVDWIEYKETIPTSIARRGIVPSRPAGREGHTATLTQVENEAGTGVNDVMVVYGGLSPNCTDYCDDLWYYDIMANHWYMLYGEWWGQDRTWQRMWDYAAYGQQHPSKRFGHNAVLSNNFLFVFGGFKNGTFDACCGYDWVVCGAPNNLVPIFPSSGCGFLHDMWSADTLKYEPFQTLISLNKHATQSSTLGTGVAALAVDGNTSGYYSDTWANSVTLTNSDDEAWWQVDLGQSYIIRNMTIYNRLDAFSERLQNFYVLFATVPFQSDWLRDILIDPLVFKTHVMYVQDLQSLDLDITARYVRIQLAGTNYLSLAEVQIWGHPLVQAWQSMEGMKKWTQVLPNSDIYPYGRFAATLTMYNEHTALLFGGMVKETPYFLDDTWTCTLPDVNQTTQQVAWSRLSMKKQQPQNTFPVGRYGHAAAFSPVCSLGYDIELGVLDGTIVLNRVTGSVPGYVYPGNPQQTPWCRGQIIIHGGRTSANRDTTDIAYPSGFLPDMWIYNVSSETISQVNFSRSSGFPSARAHHAIVLHKDWLILYGGTSDSCPGSTCGDLWMYNVSGPNSCPNDCNGHGTCEWGFCICDAGFKAVDCSELSCPQAQCSFSYSDHWLTCLECHNHGLCNTSGFCLCNQGWGGESCQLISCPGNCSGHGTCKLGGTCDCDPNFGGPDCFVAFCPNNCTTWSDGYDSGAQGECVITRNPPCCGNEPDCVQTSKSPSPCISRNPNYIPPHQVSATCVCSDTYTGIDCSQTIADVIISQQLAKGVQKSAGCFASHSEVYTVEAEGLRIRKISELQVGDTILTMNDAGKLDSTRVIFLHDHPDQVETNKISFLSSEGLVSTLELTDWHAVSSEVTCTGRNNCGIRLMYGHEMKRGHGIVRRNGDSFDTARVISIERGLSRVRYIVTGNDRLVVNQALGIVYSTALASLESLPFRFLFWLSPTLLSHPATRKSLETVLESPALRAAEMLFNHLVGMLPAWKQGSQSGSELMAGRTRSNELES